MDVELHCNCHTQWFVCAKTLQKTPQMQHSWTAGTHCTPLSLNYTLSVCQWPSYDSPFDNLQFSHMTRGKIQLWMLYNEHTEMDVYHKLVQNISNHTHRHTHTGFGWKVNRSQCKNAKISTASAGKTCGLCNFIQWATVVTSTWILTVHTQTHTSLKMHPCSTTGGSAPVMQLKAILLWNL